MGHRDDFPNEGMRRQGQVNPTERGEATAPTTPVVPLDNTTTDVAVSAEHATGSPADSATETAAPTVETPPLEQANLKQAELDTTQLDLTSLVGRVAALVAMNLDTVPVADALAAIGDAEKVKRMLEAFQSHATAHVVGERNRAQVEAGKSTRTVVAQTSRDVELHRGLSRTRAHQVVNASVSCPAHAPRLMREWEQGRVDEEKVTTFFTETSTLTDTGHVLADIDLAADAKDVGMREWRERLRRTTMRVEPERAAEKAAKANQTRHVHVRGQADGMMSLSGKLPAAAGQGVDAILNTYARSRKAAGDERTAGQIKADLLTGIVIAWARATGQEPPGFAAAHRIKRHGSAPAPTTESKNDATTNEANDSEPNGMNTDESGSDGQDAGGGARDGLDAVETPALPGVDEVGFAEVADVHKAFARYLQHPDGEANASLPAGIGVQVVMVTTDLTLFGIQDTPAEIFGLGPVPAETARTMVAEAQSRHAATLRLLYQDPKPGGTVALESKARIFPQGLADLATLRDRFCRHPYCDAPIKHMDHIRPYSEGGATSYANIQGLCAGHNLIKDTNHTTTTPVGETPGAGAIVTHLASGAEFLSPARTFPHEDPDTVSVGHYWSGYRQGRAEAETALAEREATAAKLKDKADAKQASLIRIREQLTEKVKGLQATRREIFQDRYTQRVDRDRLLEQVQSINESRIRLDHDQQQVETMQAAIDDAHLATQFQTRRLEQEARRVQYETQRLELEAQNMEATRVELARSKQELDQGWEDLAASRSAEDVRSEYLDDLWLRIAGEPDLSNIRWDDAA